MIRRYRYEKHYEVPASRQASVEGFSDYPSCGVECSTDYGGTYDGDDGNPSYICRSDLPHCGVNPFTSTGLFIESYRPGKAWARSEWSGVSEMKPAFYLWGLKPDESKPCPTQNIVENNKYLPGKVVGLNEIESLLPEYPNPELARIWPKIPRWIIKADLGRLVYLYFNGGFYFDVDCKINKNFLENIDKETILFTEAILDSTDELGPREIKDDAHKLRVANYAMGSILKNNKFYQKCIEECISRLKAILQEDKPINDLDVLWVCGPDVITTMYHRLNQKGKNEVLLLPEGTVANENSGSWRG